MNLLVKMYKFLENYSHNHTENTFIFLSFPHLLLLGGKFLSESQLSSFGIQADRQVLGSVLDRIPNQDEETNMTRTMSYLMSPLPPWSRSVALTCPTSCPTTGEEGSWNT